MIARHIYSCYRYSWAIFQLTYPVNHGFEREKNGRLFGRLVFRSYRYGVAHHKTTPIIWAGLRRNPDGRCSKTGVLTRVAGKVADFGIPQGLGFGGLAC